MSHTPRGLAAAGTPPVPPSFVPTPLGDPPYPPTMTPGAATASQTPVPTPSSTAIATQGTSFSLQAARLTHPNDPANLGGLLAVRPGTHVWLMMYYTIWRLPAAASRTTTYEIDYRGKAVFRVVFRGTEPAGNTGRFSRYTTYVLPKTLPLGSYIYVARLQLGRHTQTKQWPFAIARHERSTAGST